MSNGMRSYAQGAYEIDQARYCSPNGSSLQWLVGLWNALLQDPTQYCSVWRIHFVPFALSLSKGCPSTGSGRTVQGLSEQD
jgi:hypothetical protein